MKSLSSSLELIRQQSRTAAQTRTVVLVLVCFILGIGVGAYWFRKAARSDPPAAASEPTSALSGSVATALQPLTTPVEIRFYAPSNQTLLPETLQAFAGRVDQLLAWYDQAAGGKIRVSRLDPLLSPAAAASAKADGIKSSPLASGEVYFLALVVGHQGQNESIAPLAPEWEPALDSDLSRAILRVTSARAGIATAAQAAPADTTAARAAAQEVARVVPDVDALTAAEGAQKLREAALEQFKAAVIEMQTKVNAAQQKLAVAQGTQSVLDQQAALKELQQVQAEQTEKLKQITQRLQDQIATLEQLKGVNR